MRKKKYCTKSGKKCKKLSDSQIRKFYKILSNHNKPVITILLGAGAARIWDGPGTNDIDNLFENDTTYVSDDGRTVGSIIFQRLREYYGRVNFVNFETFINLLELIYDFIISESNEGGTDPTNTSMLPIIFNLSDLVDEIYNPNNENVFSTIIEEDPIIRRRIYFGEIIKHYLNIVRFQISTYENSNDINNNTNKSVYNWLNSLSTNFTIRIYTTNYDRIIPDILEQNNYSYFDGFKVIVENGKSTPDVYKICNNSDDLVYYQLHGSNHWEIELSDFAPFDYLLVRNGIPRDQYTYHLSSIPGQVLLKTNIITGYSKPQRIIQSPINAMYSSFIQDCLRASYVLTSGFSFGDPHLKKIIINTLDASEAKFINITNKGSIEELEELFDSTIYDDISRSLGVHFNELESVISGNWVIKGNRYYAYYGGFKSFLENEAWDIIK